jgi:hypothetical protein
VNNWYAIMYLDTEFGGGGGGGEWLGCFCFFCIFAEHHVYSEM